MFKSIRTKTLFYLVIFISCFIVVAGYIMVYGTEQIAKRILSERMQDEAVLFAGIADNELDGDNDKLEDPDYRTLVVNQVKGLKDIGSDCFMINNRGLVTGNDDAEKPYSYTFKGKSDYQEVYKNGKFYVAALAKLETGSGWYVVIEDLQSEAYSNLNLMTTITIILIVAVIILIWYYGKFLARKIASPVRELADAAMSVAEGNISDEVKTTERGELAEIADSFNILLGRLKSTMRQAMDVSGEILSMSEIMEYVKDTYDDMPGGILGINTAGEIITFNETAGAITGLEAAEIVGLDVKVNPVPAELMPLMEPLRKCVVTGSLKLKTLTDIKNTSGDILPIVYNISIQFGANDEVIGGICIFRTIDDIRRFEASAARVKNLESLGEMASSIAHEIRNPLTSIRGYAQLIEADSSLDEESSEELQIIINEVDRLNDMINGLLNFARPKVPDKAPCDLNNLIEYTLKVIKMNIPDYIDVRLDLEKLPDVMIDKELFEPVIINLITNAVQANPKNIIIETRYIKRREMVSIRIMDDGDGIPAEYADVLFDPFFTTKTKGTGLGLPIASRTVEAHGGVIEVESAKGEMTKFTILLQADSGKI